jgi:hypothetical protein
MANWIIYFRQSVPHDDVVADMTRLLSEQRFTVYNVNQPTIWPATEARQRAESGGGDWLARISDPNDVLTDIEDTQVDGWLAALLLPHGFEFTARTGPLRLNPDPLRTREDPLVPRSRRQSIDVVFEVSGWPRMETDRSIFRPTTVRVQQTDERLQPAVWVSGPLITKEGVESSRKATVLFGKYGGGFAHAPKRVMDLVDRVRRMETFDNGESD